MKTKIWIVLVVLMAGFSWQSCSDDDNPVVEEPGLPALDLTDDEITALFEKSDKFIDLPENANELLLKFATKANWSIRVGDERLRDLFEISRTEGTGDDEVAIVLKEGKEMPLLVPVVFTVTSNSIETKADASTKEYTKYFMRSVSEPGDTDICRDVMGRGFSIFEDLSDSKLQDAVFDVAKMGKDSMMSSMSGGSVMRSVSVSGTDYNSVTTSWVNQLNGTAKMDVLFGFVPPPFQASLSTMSNSKITTENYYEYCIYSLYAIPEKCSRALDDKIYSITENTDSAYMIDNVLKYLTVDAANAINGTDTDNFEEIFTLFGTHVITAANFGGRYDYLYARKDVEYEADVTNTAMIGLSGKISKNIMTSYGLTVQETYNEHDSISYFHTASINEERRIGGEGLGTDLENWLENLDKSPVSNLALISLIFSEAQPYKGAIPIYMLCLDKTRKDNMKSAWVAHINTMEKEFMGCKKIIADVTVCSLKENEGRPFHYENGLIYKKLDLNLSQVTGSNPHKDNYFYYAYGYSDDTTIGITDINIYSTKNLPKDKNWQPRGASSTDEMKGVPTKHNHIYVVKRKENTDESDLITGIRWEHLSVNSKEFQGYKFTGEMDLDNEWSENSEIEWLKGVGWTHQDMYISSTKD